jgi:hypothetical protein
MSGRLGPLGNFLAKAGRVTLFLGRVLGQCLQIHDGLHHRA